MLVTSSVAAVQWLVGSRVKDGRVRANMVIDTGIEPELLENGCAGVELLAGEEVVLRLGRACLAV